MKSPLAIAAVWLFRSGSNPNATYQALLYTDGSTSCECPGWTRRVDGEGKRSCKHVRAIELGQKETAVKIVVYAACECTVTGQPITRPQGVAAAAPLPTGRRFELD